MRCWLADFFLAKKKHNKGWTTSPSQTPAALSVAPNGDVAVGTSDGAARLWTSDPARQAPADDQWQFQVPPPQPKPPPLHTTMGASSLQPLSSQKILAFIAITAGQKT